MNAVARIANEELRRSLHDRRNALDAFSPKTPGSMRIQGEDALKLGEEVAELVRDRLTDGWCAVVTRHDGGILKHEPRALYRQLPTAFARATRLRKTGPMAFVVQRFGGALLVWTGKDQLLHETHA